MGGSGCEDCIVAADSGEIGDPISAAMVAWTRKPFPGIRPNKWNPESGTVSFNERTPIFRMIASPSRRRSKSTTFSRFPAIAAWTSTPNFERDSRNCFGEVDDRAINTAAPDLKPSARNSYAKTSFSFPGGPWRTMLAPNGKPPRTRPSKPATPEVIRISRSPPVPRDPSVLEALPGPNGHSPSPGPDHEKCDPDRHDDSLKLGDVMEVRFRRRRLPIDPAGGGAVCRVVRRPDHDRGVVGRRVDGRATPPGRARP